jgi:hypothetical protein
MMWTTQGYERGQSEHEGDEIEETRTKVDGSTSGGQTGMKRDGWIGGRQEDRGGGGV